MEDTCHVSAECSPVSSAGMKSKQTQRAEELGAEPVLVEVSKHRAHSTLSEDHDSSMTCPMQVKWPASDTVYASQDLVGGMMCPMFNGLVNPMIFSIPDDASTGK